MPLSRLLSKSYAARLRADIDPQRATPSPPAGGGHSEGTETTHFSIVDAGGSAVSCTTTLTDDFGSAVTVTGAGFLLNDEMDDFTSAPGKPNLFGLIQGEANAIAPGKRMLSAMTPSIVLDPEGRLYLILGSPGGPRITTAVYQVVSDVIDQGMSLADAVAAPRLHHQALPDVIFLERDALAPAAPAAAPASPPITAPFLFPPRIFPTIAPAAAPPPTFAASPPVTPRPCITESLDSTVASTG